MYFIWLAHYFVKVYIFHYKQQPELLAELFSYANPDEGARPQDNAPVMATYNYLSALSKLFENGFLLSSRDGSSKITNMDAQVLRNIQEGYEFFKDWWQALDEECEQHQMLTLCIKNPQTWCRQIFKIYICLTLS